VGKTTDVTTIKKSFYVSEVILKQAKKKVDEAITQGWRVDYLAFVPDGKPTSDINLQRAILC